MLQAEKMKIIKETLADMLIEVMAGRIDSELDHNDSVIVGLYIEQINKILLNREEGSKNE